MFDLKESTKAQQTLLRLRKMTKENPLSIINSLHHDLQTIKSTIYDKYGLEVTHLKVQEESKEYAACSFKLNNKTIEHRLAKITPTKTGQFVTIWKRNADGITEPFNAVDDIDYLFISTRKDDNLGQFIFPKSVLIDKGIFTLKEKDGKRGIRVYPPWDVATSKQAITTQNWQVKYFLTVSNNKQANADTIKQLLNLE